MDNADRVPSREYRHSLKVSVLRQRKSKVSILKETYREFR